MKRRYVLSFVCLLVTLLWGSNAIYAQVTNSGQPNTLFSNTPARDTNANKSNTGKWVDQAAIISYKKLNSDKSYTIDTSIHTFHRQPFSQPWNKNLGNLGAPTQSLLFMPEERVGPTLGYHVYDPYRFLVDSMKFYNTTRPYSEFGYMSGSKREQLVSIMHTQNVNPNWNFSFAYQKINSPGFYKVERNNHDAISLATNYQSVNKHYELYAAVIYNKMQHDENGGVAADSELTDGQHGNRQTVNTNFENDGYSLTRSSVSNVQRDFTILLQHSYTLGRTDTTYNEDSTKYSIKLIPRFRVTHRMELSSERHTYEDLIPDSTRYASLFNRSFVYNGFTGVDSVFSRQQWFKLDNRFLLNGLLGKEGKQLSVYAGVGNRIDEFSTEYITGKDVKNTISNYLIGEARKDITAPGQWFYQANAQLYVTGSSAGDFFVNAALGKDFNKIGSFTAGFKQQLNSAPYNYTFYGNQYVQIPESFGKETITQVYGSLQSNALKLSAGVRNYLIGNYIYIDEQEKMVQNSGTYNLSQVWVRKVFQLHRWFLDNELVYQQTTSGAPVNVPSFMGRHQLSIETYFFRNALKVATGIEGRYHTGYAPSGYDPFFNRFYYQNTYKLPLTPEASVFFNFKIKSFRAFLMVDQVQSFLNGAAINYQGYPNTDFVIRFGFNWVMIN